MNWTMLISISAAAYFEYVGSFRVLQPRTWLHYTFLLIAFQSRAPRVLLREGAESPL